MKIILPLLLVCIAGISGCQKRIIDYRNKYVGTYLIRGHASWSVGDDFFHEEYSYKGRITYDKSIDRHEMKIEEPDGDWMVFEVNRKGIIGSVNKGAWGKFHTRNNFYITWETAPSGGNGITLEGVKF